MQINRNELMQEIMLRKHIRQTVENLTNGWISETKSAILENRKQESSLRGVIKKIVSEMLLEGSDKTKQDVAISLVRDTLLAVIKIIKADQGKFNDVEVQDGFIKYCLLALNNDFEENRGEEGSESEQVLQEYLDDGDDNLDIKIKPSEHAMFIADEEVEDEEEEEEVDVKVSKEEELFLTLTDSEKVGFRYAKETTWPKVTKQIKRIHKMALPDPEIAAIYEEWLTKNIELHGQNTKEESTFESDSEEVEFEEEEEIKF
mgnify:CR=1 FL=1